RPALSFAGPCARERTPRRRRAGPRRLWFRPGIPTGGTSRTRPALHLVVHLHRRLLRRAPRPRALLRQRSRPPPDQALVLVALPEGAGAVKRRVQTATERDLAGIAAKKERDAAAPEVAFDDITGQYAHDPVTLSQMRARRSTAERLAHMERKYDALVKQLVESKTQV